ncbi:MAG: NAD(P)H-binding protein, partial [Gammaproteobacteria bacterium]|nr:NAD(P)H-binding protein [Gammaproteobacteria bacterium]
MTAPGGGPNPKRHDKPVVLVLGGSGFIGRHALIALRARGCRVVIGSRHPERIDDRLPLDMRDCERRCLNFAGLLEPADWAGVLEGVDVVVNCVGILRPRGAETYDRVHHLAPAALAAACRERHCRLIHVSALGLDAATKSGFSISKRAGEAAIRASGADWAIVRPSLLDGDGGYGAKWLRRVARWPVHPLPAGADGRIAVLDVRDLGEALAVLALRARLDEGSDRVAGSAREFDVGGLEARTLAEHLLALRRLRTARVAWRLRIPAALARFGSHVCDVLRV